MTNLNFSPMSRHQYECQGSEEMQNKAFEVYTSLGTYTICKFWRRFSCSTAFALYSSDCCTYWRSADVPLKQRTKRGYPQVSICHTLNARRTSSCTWCSVTKCVCYPALHVQKLYPITNSCLRLWRTNWKPAECSQLSVYITVKLLFYVSDRNVMLVL